MSRGAERLIPHTGTETPTGGSSEEYWSMEETLNQPCRVGEGGPMGRKPLLPQGKPRGAPRAESMRRISIG